MGKQDSVSQPQKVVSTTVCMFLQFIAAQAARHYADYTSLYCIYIEYDVATSYV